MLALLADLPRPAVLPISRAAGVGAGKVYAVLERFEKAGWAEYRQEGWDDLAMRNRRLYRLTDEGRKHAQEILK